ncbi:MAG: Calx-beta domain-containing protein [Reyranellaceae bacterium]
MANPILNVEDVLVSEGPNASATFTLRLTQPATAAASVSYSLLTNVFQRGTAYLTIDPNDQTPKDLQPANGTVNFAVGDSVKTITIPIIDDATVEPAESFIMQFTAPVNLTLGRTYAVGTIIDNDTIGTAPFVSVGDIYVNETDGTGVFNITLDRASATAIVVTYQTAALTAQSGSDFVGVQSSVTFAPGEVTKAVAVQVLDDGIAEGDEKLALQLTGATGGAVLASAQGTATIAHNDGPTAVTPVLNVPDVVVTEGPNAIATFVLSLSQPSAGATSVHFSLQAATAVETFLADFNVDYLNLSGTVTFAAGETVKTVNVPITDDPAVEPSEIFFLDLDTPVGMSLGRTSIPAAIVDNDTIGAAPLVSVNDVFVNESDGEAHFAITLDKASTSAVTVSYKTVDSSALSGSDYVGVTSSVVFLPGETAKVVAVSLIDDGVAEIDERFNLQVTAATGGAVLANAQGTAIIEHNDGATSASPLLTADDIVVGEGAPAAFVLRLGQPAAGSVSVTYSISTGTASNTTDYWFNTDTIRFAAGETVKVVTIPTIDDVGVEPAEFFLLSLTSPQGLTLARSKIMANIIDNDAVTAAPLVSVSDTIVNEDVGDAHFTITLDQASATPITVTYKTVDGSAVAGSDYVGVSSSVVFLPGEMAKTIAVQVLDDAVAEGDEKLSFQVTAATGGAVLADPQGVATIEHNDGITAATPILNFDDVVVSEGPNAFATFVLRLNQPSTSVTAVTYTSAFSTAANGFDYISVGDTIRFAPGETVQVVKIPILDDAAIESTESVVLQLSSPQGLTLAKSNAVGKIIDNDTIGTAPLMLVGDALVNEGDGFAHLAITLDRASASMITVNVQTIDGSAVAGSDYLGVATTVVFLPGETAKTVDVQLVDDAVAEPEEKFGIQLSGVTGGAVLADSDGTVTIDRSDGAVAALPVLNVEDIIVGEGGSSMATFILRLTQPSASVTSVSLTLSSATASSTNDYLFLTEKFTFAPGETVKTYSIPIVEDALVEQAESFVLGLNSAQGLALGRTVALATILDNDTTGAAPLLSVNNVFVNEADGDARFTLMLDRASSTPITVSYQTADGLAQAGLNYVAAASSVVFLPGETVKTVAVQLIDDGLPQADETLNLQITGATGGAVVADGVGTALIARSDLPTAVPVLNVDDVLVSEGGTSVASFVLRLSQPSATAASVSYSIQSGTANFQDLNTTSDGAGTVTFAPGETIRVVSVSIINDAIVEPVENFSLSLSGAQGLTLGRTSIAATIIDDDGLVLADGIDSLKAEGQAGNTAMTFSISLKQALATSQTLNWAVAGFGNHPASAADFAGGVLPSGSVVFAPGETRKVVTVNVAGDTTFEGDEAYVLNVTDPSATLGIGTVQALGTIVDDDSLGVTISTVTSSALEANTGSTLFTFTVSLNRAAVTAQSVGWAVTGSGNHAADAADFTGGVLPTGTVSFAIGETSKTITVAVAGDTQLEADETFVVNVTSASSGVVVGSFLAQATILNDDTLSASISALSAIKAEGQAGPTSFTFTVALSGAAAAIETINWVVSGSGANPANAADFAGGVLPSGTVTFAAGESSKTITVSVASDNAVETDEGFTVSLSNPAPGLTIGIGSASGTILNDDAVVSVAAAAAIQQEGNGGGTAFTFTVSQTGDTSVAHTVSWAVTGAVDGADFVGSVLPSGVVTFASGETSKTITVTVAGDATVEADEGFLMTLSNPSSGLVIGTATAAGAIVNDDASVSLAAQSATKAEGSAGTTPFSFVATLTGDASIAHSVSWTVAGSGANPADAGDFAGGVLPSGSVTFAPGETSKTITVNVAADATQETDEGFVMTLSGPSSGLGIGTAAASGTIQNDDGATVSIAALAATQAEGNSGTTAFTFTATLTGDNSIARTVSWAVAGAGATPANAADFSGGVLPSGSVTFASGETSKTVTVLVAGDTAVESAEGFAVNLSNPSAGLIIGTGSATGSIVNDDASVSLAALAAIQPEGNAGTTAFTFTATLTGDTSVAHTVAYGVTGSGANPANAADFSGGVLPTGTVTFAIGETAKTVTVLVAGDTTVESDEGFAVALSAPSTGLTIGTPSASGTITNDDKAAAIAAHDDAYIVLKGQSLNIGSTIGLLANDDNASSATLASGPAHGTLQLATNGGFTYGPAAGFANIDSFTYHSGNGSSSADAHALLYVIPTLTGGTSTTLDLLGLTAEEQIAATYIAFFGRGADASGFNFWVGQFQANLPTQGGAALFANIASSFGVSDEAKGLYPFLVNPFGASDPQISAFIDSVYLNMFNRGSDAAGLAYWTGQTKATLAAGQFVGSILVNIMSGAQNTADGQDISTLMGKVAVSLDYVQQQTLHGTHWNGTADTTAATNLLHGVTSDPGTVLAGIKNADTLIANHA